MKAKHNVRKQNQTGVALVTTVIVVAVLAVVAVAFMQSASTDRLSSRTVANYHQAQLAAEAGLADAVATLRQGIQDFNYVSGAKPDSAIQGSPSYAAYRTFVRPRRESEGSWVFAGPEVFLDSGINGERATLVVSGPTTNSNIVVQPAYKTMQDADDPLAVKRYAFWVDEDGGKQNLDLWGRQSAPALQDNIENVSSLPLLLPNADGSQFSQFNKATLDALDKVVSFDATNTNAGVNILLLDNSLPSVPSANLLGGTDANITRYFFSMGNVASAVTPKGRRKLNLKALEHYLKTELSSTAQGAESPKAELVELLLEDPPADEQAVKWGYGDLSWLKRSGYSESEQKQIVANLIDYLDLDIIPTTDSVDSPSYFGVESRVQGGTLVRGHPVISYVGLGLQVNVSPNGDSSKDPPVPKGAINSTRVLCALGLLNPWGVSVRNDNYSVKMSVEVLGDVSSGLPISQYFPARSFTDRVEGTQWDGDGSIEEYGVFMAAGKTNINLRSMNDFVPLPGDEPPRVPVGVTFSNIQYRVESIQLLYSPTDGSDSGVVATISGLPLVDAEPRFFTLPVGNPRTTTLPAGKATNEIYLANDPRAAFRASSYIQTNTTYSGEYPKDPNVEIFREVNLGTYDGMQGATNTIEGLRSPAMAFHLSRAPYPNFQSIGELGFIWSGKPWQTLNLTDVKKADKADWNLLDYLTMGWPNSDMQLPDPDWSPSRPSFQSTTPYSYRIGPGVTLANGLVQQAGFNINARKIGAPRAVMENRPGLASEAFDRFAALEPADQASAYGAFAVMNSALSGSESDAPSPLKFTREEPVRALANVIVAQSRLFRVYAKGQYRQGGKVAEATLEADLFVDVDPSSLQPRVRVINKIFK